MALITQKCQYALRSIVELARHYRQGPVRIADIAESQAIPQRFLEVILNELKQGGFAESQRGCGGGYTLARPPDQLTVGDIIRFVEGPLVTVECVSSEQRAKCPLYGDCVFLPMWEKASRALAEVYDGTTIADLVEAQRKKASDYVPHYAI